MAEGGRERDLVLAQNEYCLVMDETKGKVNVLVGPHKASLSATDRPVKFDPRSNRFTAGDLQQATQPFVFAEEGSYVVLENPARDDRHPQTGNPDLIDLQLGKKVNIPGPVSFALWPGQSAKTIEGHRLRSNQYLIIRVYNVNEAKANWQKAVVQTQASGEPPGTEGPPAVAAPAPELTMGQLLIIKGTDVSFYIPPTGIEVVPDERGQYVREAVTLESLEYAILLDENGEKRYLRGPDVVFPDPTEAFVRNETDGSFKFKAIELNEISGVYVKVIADYADPDGTEHRVGEEIFVTGKDAMFYFPRAEQAIITYGDGQQVHYAIAIPAGESRYVLDRLTGDVTVVEGPKMFLPDPRKQVIVRRILDEATCKLWFPGSEPALQHNRRLREAMLSETVGLEAADLVSEEAVTRRRGEGSESRRLIAGPSRDERFAGDAITRKGEYSPPRTITLDTKYDGAITIEVFTGYAILVVSRSGARRVVRGPTTVRLAYDETLEAMELSKGTPKGREQTLKTVYLRSLYNRVTDEIRAETSDLCQVRILVSYRVNFEADEERWFNVVDYVGFLCDHLRSFIRNTVKQLSIEAFHGDAIKIVRDAILGQAGEDSRRPGRPFEENGMRVYEVDVQNVTIDDRDIQERLVEAQRGKIRQVLEIASARQKLELTIQTAAIDRQIATEQAATAQERHKLQAATEVDLRQAELAKLQTERAKSEAELGTNQMEAELSSAIATIKLASEKATADQAQAIAEARQTLRLALLTAEVEADQLRAGAISADLIQALQAFGDRDLAGKLAQSMAPLAMFQKTGVLGALQGLLKGTPIGKVLAEWDGGTPAESAVEARR